MLRRNDLLLRYKGYEPPKKAKNLFEKTDAAGDQEDVKDEGTNWVVLCAWHPKKDNASQREA